MAKPHSLAIGVVTLHSGTTMREVAVQEFNSDMRVEKEATVSKEVSFLDDVTIFGPMH